MITKILRSLFNVVGFEVRRKQKKGTNSSNNQATDINEMRSALERIKKLGIDPDYIIDIGAAKGMWSMKALEVWPQSNFILIEPLPEQVNMMPSLFRSNSKVKIYEAVAGQKEGIVHFNVSDDLDGSGVYEENRKNARQVKVIALDDVCDSSFKSILLKLDTHGYEIPIFEGGSKILERTTAIIVEVYGFYVSPTAKLFHEISTYLAGNGFRLFDIVDVMRRSEDKAFWQADAVFLKSSHELFKNNRYSP